MTDVRSMLRAEREKRKITHPHASYTADGKLLCNLCETLVKSDTAWQSHLHSSQHTLRLNRGRDAAITRGTDGGTRKRKASDLDSPALEERKKAKPDLPSSPTARKGGAKKETPEKSVKFVAAQQEEDAVQQVSNTEDEVDAAQLELFERELAGMEAEMQTTATLQVAPTISAAPLTAAEVAAQAREEQSAQRGKRDAELEAEKEDAARLLEDEFEQMESFEERVKKLRERREALRKQTDGHDAVDGQVQTKAADTDNQGHEGSNASALPADDASVATDADADEDGEESNDDWYNNQS